MKKETNQWVAVSGGFDPLHIGHVRMFKEARKHGKKLVVILNNDNWLRDKKGFVFMTQDERKELLLQCGLVDKVVITSHKKGDPDRSVNRELAALKPAVFVNGGDRKLDNIPEVDVCHRYGIKMAFNAGKGGKVQSSSWLTNKVRMTGVKEERPWGRMVTYAHGENYWLKTLTLIPGGSTSLQTHKHRSEYWLCVEGVVVATIGDHKQKMTPGMVVAFDKEMVHRLSSEKGGTIVEMAYGKCDEKDITRLDDAYGRV